MQSMMLPMLACVQLLSILTLLIGSKRRLDLLNAVYLYEGV